ncbi:MAG TPA: DUF814 domain-containing protein [Planctomycetes bacterium]|nr:DUF814 domain-containing protein [Planctomycetota bacterium]
MEELAPLLEGTRLREVEPLPPRDLLLILEPEDGPRDGPAVFRLRLSVAGDGPRVHLQQGRQKSARGPTGPFFQRLALELVGARLARIQQVRGDRVMLLEFRETPAGGRRGLLAELTGRHANLVLLGRSDEVLDVLVPAPKQQATSRLRLGAPWAPPPGLAARPGQQPALEDEFPEPKDPPPAVRAGHPQRAPLSWRVECELGADAAERDAAELKKRFKKRYTRKLSKARSNLRGLERRLEATADAERVRLDGELLSANRQALQRGAEFIELSDWYAEGTPLRRISLDPRRSPKENIERLFERYKKLQRSAEKLPAELDRARSRIAELEEFWQRAEKADANLTDLDNEAVERGLFDALQEGDPRKRKTPAPRLPYLTFQGAAGAQIRVGRSAKDNDALTFKHARGTDLWLHTADAPGSHVVLCMGGSRGEPDPEDLLDALHLALHFSPLRGARGGSIHVALRKLVHKPRGAKAGLVTLSGGKRIELRVQPDRLARLVRPGKSS